MAHDSFERLARGAEAEVVAQLLALFAQMSLMQTALIEDRLR
jgi:hypothetical protein